MPGIEHFITFFYDCITGLKPSMFFLYLHLYPYQASNTKQTHPVATDTHVILNCERRYNTFCAIFILWWSKFTTLICCKTKYGDDPSVAVPPTHRLGEPGKYNIFCIALIFRLKLAALIVKCSSASHWLGDENIIFSLLLLFSDLRCDNDPNVSVPPTDLEILEKPTYVSQGRPRVVTCQVTKTKYTNIEAQLFDNFTCL